MPSSQAPRSYGSHSSTSSTHCLEPRPPGTRSCLLRDCPHTAYWKVGPWSKVKKSLLASEKSSQANHFLHKTFWWCAHFTVLLINVDLDLVSTYLLTVLLYCVLIVLCLFVFIPVLTDLWSWSDGAKSGVCNFQRPPVQTLPSIRQTWVPSRMSRQRM